MFLHNMQGPHQRVSPKVLKPPDAMLQENDLATVCYCSAAAGDLQD